MGYVSVQEPVEVWVHVSAQGEVRPLAFSWSGRRQRVRQITYRWRAGKGRDTWRYFTVTTESRDAYQLCYREESSTWWLEQVWTAG